MNIEKDKMDFVRSLVKGKIAEVIFHELFQESKTGIIIPFGYEYITPMLAQYQHTTETKEELENIRNTPDFILISPDHTHVRFVDVKYRKVKNNQHVKEIAEKISKRWSSAWIFLATPDGFYFSSCKEIIAKNGEIESLRGRLAADNIQDAYLKVLQEFEH